MFKYRLTKKDRKKPVIIEGLKYPKTGEVKKVPTIKVKTNNKLFKGSIVEKLFITSKGLKNFEEAAKHYNVNYFVRNCGEVKFVRCYESFFKHLGL